MPKSRSTTAKLPPVHPGEILRETLDDLGLSMNQLAQEIHEVPARRLGGIEVDLGEGLVHHLVKELIHRSGQRYVHDLIFGHSQPEARSALIMSC